jgi:hypothetical protein
LVSAAVLAIALFLILTYQAVCLRRPTEPVKNQKPPTLQTYSVSFLEYGLLADSSWSISFNGTTYVSAAAGITVYGVEDGNYSFSVGNVGGYVASPSAGFVMVNGSNTNEVIAFSATSVAAG